MSPISILLILTTICGYAQARQVGVSDKLRMVLWQNNQQFGILTIALFGGIAPKMVRNFVTLASRNGYNGQSYVGSKFHLIDQEKIDGGKITPSGSTSIYNGQPFAREPNSLSHKEAGLLSMTLDTYDEVGSQFIITTPLISPLLDEKHVVIGKLLDQESYRTLDAITNVEVDEVTFEPKSPITIHHTETIPVAYGGEDITVADYSP